MPNTQGHKKISGPPLHPYEAARLSQCMQNNARLQQLGLPLLGRLLANSVSGCDKNKRKRTSCEGSESDYNPDHDDGGEGHLVDPNNAKDLKKTCKKTCDTRTGQIPPLQIKTRLAKRVVAEQPTTRATRSKTSLTIQDGGLGNLHKSTPSLPHASQPEETTVNLDGYTQPIVQDNVLAHLDDTAQPDEHNQMASEGPEGDDNSEGEEVRCIRGINMGKGLQKLTRARRGKLPIVIPEGMIRPVVPIVAAKFATECNIAVRNHVPVFKHWKDYKRKPAILRNFISKVAAKFDMDITSDHVKKACSEMMKSAVRQQRYRLKTKYFDPFPLHLVRKTTPVKTMTDTQWNDLVEGWKDPKKMGTCEKNKENRAQVIFHHTTGSRSYPVHVENLGDKYEDEQPTALDLFKECHYSQKKKGFTSSVQSAINQMKNRISELPEGEQQPNSVANIVVGVLSENTKNNKFLKNVGIQVFGPRSTVKNLEAQLVVQKRSNAQLQMVVDNQQQEMEVLSNQLHQAEQARIRDREEMNKKQADTDAKLELLLRQIQQS